MSRGNYDNDDWDYRDDALKIRTRGSKVVKVKEWDERRWKREDIDRNDRYYLQDGLLVHERRNRVRYYNDDNGDGIWQRTNLGKANNFAQETSSDLVISGGTSTMNRSRDDDWHDDDRKYRSGYGEDAYRFDLVNEQVTNLQEFNDGHWKPESIDYDETWSFDGTNLIRTEQERYGSEISTFSDPDKDGVFTKVSKIYAANV